ncbi:hypothetical protein E0Z10_g6912 [Xylaria hypoxylon]|uniref:Cupin 2 conserved barrel domain-containing protein n=1 Tax=Xylaria hypoxylon TaxID=37992 RepID=A0A4Z0YS31_9PEZI|nr:hypothetical protein E0Z10_g6912 [Xylaria hypoxylon]
MASSHLHAPEILAKLSLFMVIANSCTQIVVRMIDFAPGVESPMHHAVSIDYGIVVEGVFELVLDFGEKRIMRQRDVSINRAAAYRWKNITGNGTLLGRMMWILLDCKDVYVNGKKIEEFLGDLVKEYVDQGVEK